NDHLSVSCGSAFTCTLHTDGQLWCFGAGTSGQLGAGEFDGSVLPVQVDLAEPALQLSAGHSHACAVAESGALFCWGANAEGQLGQDDPFPAPGTPSASPVRVGTDSD